MVGETWDTWRESVRRTLELDPDSVTIYQMELPYNTVYSREVLDAGAPVPVADWPTKRAWQDHAYERLEAAGHSVSSAYTMIQAGGRFVYRDAVWHGADLLGTGGAFSHSRRPISERVGLGAILRRRAGEVPLARAFDPRARAADAERS